MRSIRAWLLRLRGVFGDAGGAGGDGDFAAELDSHLQLHIDVRGARTSSGSASRWALSARRSSAW